MSFSEIISDNCENHSKISWWPKFAYHYTDVSNAVNILSTELLYSRLDASKFGVMENDNASRRVIDMTNSDVVSKVRFYFRPLTPTQYYNEGYKHIKLRYDGDIYANTPVPVFFLFDLDGLLSDPNVSFSETSQAGYGARSYSGVEDFSKLNFDLIYSIGYENFDVSKRYRHAEINHNGSLEIGKYLKAVLCRSNIERTTLLNLLKEKSQLNYNKYRDIIKVPKTKSDVFECNGLYITDCLIYDNSISILFSDSFQKKSYANKMISRLNDKTLDPIDVRIELTWFNSRNIVYHQEISTVVDYINPNQLSITKLPAISRAKEIGIKVFFDDKLMCYTKQSIQSEELLK